MTPDDFRAQTRHGRGKLVRAALARFGGVEIDTAGDGFMTKFKSPSSAIRCALELIEDAETSGRIISARESWSPRATAG